MAKTIDKEMEKSMQNVDAFNESVNSMTLDRMNQAPKQDVEPQTKLAQADIDKSKDIYLKPKRTIASKEAFNEKFRADYNFQKEYVQFIAENREIIGEDIEMWTKPFPGLPAENWIVPTNKPVWGPRYLAENIKNRTYHRFSMQNTPTTQTHEGQFYGAMVVDNTIQRLDAYPVNTRKSLFMGATNF